MTIGGGRILKPASEGTDDGTHPEYSGIMRDVVACAIHFGPATSVSPRLSSIRLKLGAAA